MAHAREREREIERESERKKRYGSGDGSEKDKKKHTATVEQKAAERQEGNKSNGFCRPKFRYPLERDFGARSGDNGGGGVMASRFEQRERASGRRTAPRRFLLSAPVREGRQMGIANARENAPRRKRGNISPRRRRHSCAGQESRWKMRAARRAGQPLYSHTRRPDDAAVVIHRIGAAISRFSAVYADGPSASFT